MIRIEEMDNVSSFVICFFSQHKAIFVRPCIISPLSVSEDEIVICYWLLKYDSKIDIIRDEINLFFIGSSSSKLRMFMQNMLQKNLYERGWRNRDLSYVSNITVYLNILHFFYVSHAHLSISTKVIKVFLK